MIATAAAADTLGIVEDCWPMLEMKCTPTPRRSPSLAAVRRVSRLGLAQAYAVDVQFAKGGAAESARAKARAAYEDFLTLWKDADPDIPILIGAKAEYAKLQ